MTPEAILFYILAFVYGITIGSFLNVCIYRIPQKENIAKVRSHCMNCGYQLKWYDLVPLFSYIALGGRCRTCKKKISMQYPLIEALNGIFYVLVLWQYGLSWNTVIFCLMSSALLALSVIDFRTFEIPIGFNVFLLTLGLIHLALDYTNCLQYVIGLVVVSGFLLIIYAVTKGRGIGGGDIKLMAVCGLLIGWKLIILAFILGCIVGAVIHCIRMRVVNAERMLAMGPYLSIGVFVAVLWGRQILEWYMTYWFS
ncbi:MAG: prepilin peptidase [Clostridia bacterium]|nr:prepilin peptidase [Clostridia bacterium]